MKVYIAVSAVIALINSALLFASPSYASEFLEITGKSNRFPPSFPKTSGPAFPNKLPGHWDLNSGNKPNNSIDFDFAFANDPLASCSQTKGISFFRDYNERMQDYEDQMDHFTEQYFQIPQSSNDGLITIEGVGEFVQEAPPLFKEAYEADVCNPNGAKTLDCAELLEKALSDPMQANYDTPTLGKTLVDFDKYKKSRPLIDTVDDPNTKGQSMDDDVDDLLLPIGLVDAGINAILDRDDLSDEQKAQYIDDLLSSSSNSLGKAPSTGMGLPQQVSGDEVEARKKMTDELMATIDFKMASGKPVTEELEVLQSINPSAAAAMSCFLDKSPDLKDRYRANGSVHNLHPKTGKIVGPLSGVVYADEDNTRGILPIVLNPVTVKAIAAGVALTGVIITAAVSYINTRDTNQTARDVANVNAAAQNRATDAQNAATAAQNAATAAQTKNNDTTNKTQLFIECKSKGWGNCDRYDPYPKDKNADTNANGNPADSSASGGNSDPNSNPPKTTNDQGGNGLPPEDDDPWSRIPTGNPTYVNDQDGLLPELPEFKGISNIRMDPDHAASPINFEDCAKKIRDQTTTKPMNDFDNELAKRIEERIIRFGTPAYHRSQMNKTAQTAARCLDRDYNNEQ